MLSSQSAFPATSSTSFLSRGDWEIHINGKTHTYAQLFPYSSLPLLMPNCKALDFPSGINTEYIRTTMNHCLFNERLMQGHKFLSCLQLNITEQQHTWSGRRHHSGCRSHCQEQGEKLMDSWPGSHCLHWRQGSLVSEVACLWPSGCLLGLPAMGFCLWT